ncbi:glycosyltransferase, partial [Vibrio vulnificus]
MTDYQACFLIPCYNHGETIGQVIDSLQEFALPVIIVDDGSNFAT